MSNKTQKFFEALFGNVEGQIALNYPTSSGGMKTDWFPAENIAGLITRAKDLTDLKRNVYFGCAPRYMDRAISARGTSDDISGLSALWVEIDYKSGNAHSEKAIPENRQEALAFIDTLPHPPGAVVASGNGFHLYWWLKKPVIVTDQASRKIAAALLKDWETYIQELALSKHGWKFDSVSDLPRILRVPGTLNFKSNPGKRVEILSLKEDLRYDIEVFAAFRPKPAATRKAANDNNDDKNADINEIKTLCSWVNYYADHQDEQTEPIWHQLNNLAAFCKNGVQVAHNISKHYPGYNANETARKIQQTIENSPGPTTCKYIENKLGGAEHCQTCKFRDKIRSPIQLGKINAVYTEFAYVVDINRFVRLSDNKLLSKESFTDLFLHAGLGKNPSATVLASPLLTKAISKTYRPGKPLFTETENGLEVNCWTSSGVVPSEGDARPFFQHIEYLYPDRIENQYILNYFAHLVQYPDQKIRHVLMLGGPQGNGKSFLGKVMGCILGAKNTTTIDATALHANYNGWADNTHLLVIEEMMHPGRLEIYNKLKTLISEDSCPINEKYVPEYYAPTPRGILAFTNHRVPIFMEEYDRRYFFVFSEQKPKDPSYYTDLWAWAFDNLGVILNYLLKRDISSFNASMPPPLTKTKEEVIKGSLPPLEAEIQYLIEEETHPFHRDLVTSKQVQSALDFHGQKVSMQKIAVALKNFGSDLGQVRISNSHRPRLYAIRRHKIWENASDQERSQHFLSNDPSPIVLAS